jgi:1-acyl-sn-glycerol-3-phosphate acyltransferase
MSDLAEPQAAEPPLLLERTLTYRFLTSLAWLGGHTFFPLSVSGREKIPMTGPVVFAANHQSFLDIPLLASLVPRHVSFVARASLAQSKVMDFIMKQCGAVLVRRGEADVTALRAMVAHLQAGDGLCVFPEGTRSRDGSLGPFLRGALMAARRGRAPIIPVGIRGSFEAWPPGQRFPHPHRIQFAFGDPIDSAEKNALEMVRSAVEVLIQPR